MWLLLLKKGTAPEEAAKWVQGASGCGAVLPSGEAWERSQPFTEGNFQAYVNWCINATAAHGDRLFVGAMVPEGAIGMGTKTLIERFQAAGRPVWVLSYALSNGQFRADRLSEVIKTTGAAADGWMVR
jgi:hypothetical protein